jgi:hypothetical protein
MDWLKNSTDGFKAIFRDAPLPEVPPSKQNPPQEGMTPPGEQFSVKLPLLEFLCIFIMLKRHKTYSKHINKNN